MQKILSSEYSPLRITYLGLRGFFSTVSVNEVIILSSSSGQLESFHCIFLKIALLIPALYKYYYFLISVLFFFSGKIIKGSNFDKGVVEYIFMGS